MFKSEIEKLRLLSQEKRDGNNNVVMDKVVDLLDQVRALLAGVL